MDEAPTSATEAQVIELLARLRNEADLTQQEMADQLGVKRDRYAKWEKKTPLPPEFMMKAAKILKVSPITFLTGRVVKEILPFPDHDLGGALTGTVPISVVGAVQAGLFKEALEWPPGDRETISMPENVAYAGKPLQGLKVVGPSMDQWYPDGSYVVVLPTIFMSEGWLPASGQHVIVQRRNEWGEYEATIKEVAYDGDDILLWPRSSHPDFAKPWRITAPKGADPTSDDEPIRITGLVVWAVRPAPGV